MFFSKLRIIRARRLSTPSGISRDRRPGRHPIAATPFFAHSQAMPINTTRPLGIALRYTLAALILTLYGGQV
jgi:hypothetical protein